jgi:hypothetical protein
VHFSLSPWRRRRQRWRCGIMSSSNKYRNKIFFLKILLAVVIPSHAQYVFLFDIIVFLVRQHHAVKMADFIFIRRPIKFRTPRMIPYASRLKKRKADVFFDFDNRSSFAFVVSTRNIPLLFRERDEETCT